MSNYTHFPIPETRENLVITLAKRVLAGVGRSVGRFHAVNELEQLSDRQLRDIGVERRQIEEIADREIARLRAQ